MQTLKKFTCHLAYALLIFLASHLHAWDLPVQQISPIGDFSHEPAVAIALNSSNQGLATWSHLDTNYIIQAAHFDGNTWSAPVNVSTAGQDASLSRVGMDNSGNGHAVWCRSDGSNIVIQTSFFNGSTWSAPINLSLTGQDAADPQISVNDSNRALAVWTRNDGSNDVIQASFYDGTNWSSPVTISTTGQDASTPQISINLTNKGMAVWKRSDGSNIITQAVFFDGTSWGSPVNLSVAGFDSSDPQVSLNNSNIAFAAWTLNDGSNNNVESARYNGSSWSMPLTVSSDIDTSSPQIKVWPSGDALAVWRGFDGSDSIKYSIYSGGTWSSPMNIVSFFPSYVRLGINSTSLATIVVINLASDLSGDIIQASQFDGTSWSSPIDLTTIGQVSYTPEIAVSPNGNAIAVMAVDTGGGTRGIFATENLTDESNSTISALPTMVTADGIDFSTITVTLLDNSNLPIPLHTVTLNQGSGSSNIVPSSGMTDASGIVQFTVTNTTVETVTYIATDTTTGFVLPQNVSVSFINDESFYSTVTSAPASVLNDGTSTSTITVTLFDGSNPIVGNNVSLSQGGGSSIISSSSGPSDASGQVTFTVTNTVDEIVTYTATDTTTSVTILQTASVTFFADETTTSTVAASPTSVLADGMQFSTVTVTLLDGLGNPIVGNSVSLSQGGGSSVISAPSGPSDALGQVTFTVTNSTSQTVTYTATDITSGKTLLQTASVTFVNNESTASMVIANPTIVMANGADSSIITVTLLDASLNPIVGNTVSLSQGGGSSIIGAPSGPSDAFGQVTFTVTDTTPETVTYQARDETTSVNIIQTASVTFIPLESSLSTVVAATSMVLADGTSSTTITVTLRDGFGNPIVGNAVTLSQGGGSSVITPLSGISNAFGQVTFTVRNSTAETVIYQATDVTNGVIITETSSVTFVAVMPPDSPSNFKGLREKNKFATQTAYLDVLTWDPSPDQTIVNYEIYENGFLVALVPASGPFIAKINGINKHTSYTYVLFAVDADGLKSLPITTTVP